MLPFFLNSILCDVKMRSVSHRVTTRKCGYKATTLGDCSFPWKLEVPELTQKTLLLVKNGHLLRKTTAILFFLRASWIECENKILFIPKWQRISFLSQILRPGRRTTSTFSAVHDSLCMWFTLRSVYTSILWRLSLSILHEKWLETYFRQYSNQKSWLLRTVRLSQTWQFYWNA